MTGLRWALGFITILPVRPREALAEGELGRAAAWFPLVGLGLGGLLWLSFTGLGRIFPPMATAAITVALWAVATGGLHLDGVADCFDGMLASTTAERRLQILSDVHIGAFGVVGLSLLLILKTASLAATTDPAALLLVPAVARWLPLLMARAKPAKADGLGGRLHQELRRADLMWAPPLAIASLLFGWMGVAALVGALISALGLGWLARKQLGGQTGDVLGAAIELGETAGLLVFAAVIG